MSNDDNLLDKSPEAIKRYALFSYIFSMVAIFIFLIWLLSSIIAIISVITSKTDLISAVTYMVEAVVAFLFILVSFFVCYPAIETVYHSSRDDKFNDMLTSISENIILITIIFNGLISGIFLLLIEDALRSYKSEAIPTPPNEIHASPEPQKENIQKNVTDKSICPIHHNKMIYENERWFCPLCRKYW